MTSTTNPMSNFILTPQQQNLLFAALNSNRPTNAQSKATTSLSPTSFNSFQNSPEIDYEYDFRGPDSSFDFSFENGSQPKMIGDLPASSTAARSDSGEAESPDKRSHPDDEETSSPKRRESEDKVAKKPGRKPLMTEPSSKRKAQNRAAQRAFRERKEKHLKDLENKVQELEAASQSANHENERLRAQVNKITVELNEYKKQVSLMSRESRSSRPTPIWGAPLTTGIGDVNFHFEFPKFGALSGVSSSAKSKKISPTPASGSSQSLMAQSTSPNSASPGQDSQANKEDLSALTNGVFSPPLTNQNIAKAARNNSSDSQFSVVGAASTSSPSASSNSNLGGPSSSCGTSPEPFTQSPVGFKPVDTLTTIGEEQSSADGPTDFDQFANIDLPDFNWLPQNFQFDPQLFGDYREPQENILSSGFDDTFFNDAFDVDFTTPYNLPITTPAAPKKDLISEIDAAKESDDAEGTGQLLTCNKIWEKLQGCPKVQNGDFDLDGLCSDLQKKAKCSGTGAVVDEKDFKMVMKKYLGERKLDELVECTGEMKA